MTRKETLEKTIDFDDAINRIVSLEKRNTELKETYKKQRNKRIDELQKKNHDLEAQIEKMKSQYDYAFNQLCKSREILCSMLSQYRDRKEIDYSTRVCGEKLLKEGVFKND